MIVFASTDYDHRQAETFKIKAIEGQTVRFDGLVKNMHYGETYMGKNKDKFGL